MRFLGRRGGSGDQQPAEVPADDVPIRDETIRLGQFLKLANLVDTGADAKIVIAEGAVLVDGVVETRRGRQLAAGTLVEYAGRRARVTRGDGEIDVPW